MFAMFKKIFLACIFALVVFVTGAWQNDHTALAESQNGIPETPLYSGLTWFDLGSSFRDITVNVNGDTISLSGETYQAAEQFASGIISQDVLNYYSNGQLIKSGWVSYDASEKSNGFHYVFYHESGVYLSIEFLKCPNISSNICVTIWKSKQTNLITPTTSDKAPNPSHPTANGSFGKSSPANGTTGLNPANVVLSWGTYSPTPDKYSYCIKAGSECDANDPNWTGTYTNTSVTLTNLANNTTYYWQVKAITCITCVPKTYVYADGGTVWTFKTKQNQVTISGNAGIAGAILSYTDGTPKTVTADGTGAYSITVPVNWSGTVTPAKPGYMFSPKSASFSNLTANQTIQNFTAILATVISGNAGAAGVTLTYIDGTPQVVTSDSGGNYSIVVPSPWSGIITPSLSGVTFTPTNRSYNNVTSTQVAQNYIASVTLSGNAGVGGVTLSYTEGVPETVIADGSGNYSITVLYGWSGVVTPSLASDTFCPASQTYTNVTTSKTLQNYAHETCQQFSGINKWTSAFDLSHGWTVASYVRTAGDVNNDGKDDLVGFGQDGVYVALSNGTSFDAISKWTSSFDLSHGWTVASYVRTVGDVNNDGMADLVGFGQDGVYVALSNGTSFGAISKWTSSFDLTHGWTVKDYVRTVGDVNNDGRADLVGFGQDGVYVALSNGTSFDPISKWTSSFDLSHGWTVASYVRTVGDVNADGRVDLIGFGQDGVYVALSNGTSFGAISKWTSAFDLSHGWTVKDYVRTVGDVNNDGRVDLIGFGQDGVYIALSMGTTFSLPSRRTTSFDLAHGWTVASYVRTVGDVSGDGKADLVGFGLDGVYVVLAQ